MKKLLAILLTLMMIIGLAASALAATITVHQKNLNGTTGAETYRLFKIFDVKKTAEAKATFAEVPDSATFDADTTYYTKTETYTAQDGLTAFVSGVDYYVITDDTTTPPTYTKNTEEYHSSITYYTLTEKYTEAEGLTAFAADTTYYTKTGPAPYMDTNNGTIGTATAEGYAYTISSKIVTDASTTPPTTADNPWFAKLGTVDSDGKWTAASGQKWVTLTKSAADPTVYNVTWSLKKDSSDELDESEDAAKAFAAWLYQYVEVLDEDGNVVTAGISPDKTITSASGTATTTEVDDGYYLIDSTVGTALILATSNIDITTKNSYISDDKIVERADITVGEKATYYITVNLPTTIDPDSDVIVHDILDPHLKFDKASLKYYVCKTSELPTDLTASTISYAADTAYVVDEATLSSTVSGLTDGCTFEITIPSTKIAALMDANKDTDGKFVPVSVVIKYEAELLSASQIDETDLTAADHGYVNTEFAENSKFKTVPHKPEVFTYDFDIEKIFVGDEKNTDLKATFELYPEAKNSDGAGTGAPDTTKIVLTEETEYEKYYKTDSDDTETNTTIKVKQGTVCNVRGLAAGTYFLRETSTAEGYNLLTGDVKVVIDDKGNVTYSYGTASNATGSGFAKVGDTDTFKENEKYYTKTETETYPEITPNVNASNFSTEYYTLGTDGKYAQATAYDPDTRYYEKVVTVAYTLETSVTADNFADKKADPGLYILNTVEIENKSGTILPSTGSFGVYPFYIGGGLMAVGAGVVLVTRKRMGKEEEEE